MESDEELKKLYLKDKRTIRKYDRNPYWTFEQWKHGLTKGLDPIQLTNIIRSKKHG